MLSTVQSRFQQLCVNKIAKYIAIRFSPNQITFLACLMGIAVFPCLLLNLPLAATIFLLISGYLDMLDGAVARVRQMNTDLGAVLDIVSDRVVEYFVVFALFSIDPLHRSWPSMVMLGSILLCVSSFLVVGIFTHNQSNKSFYYSPGLMERAEAFLFFILMIWIPDYFTGLALTFSALTLLTAGIRIKQFAYCSIKVNYLKAR